MSCLPGRLIFRATRSRGHGRCAALPLGRQRPALGACANWGANCLDAGWSRFCQDLSDGSPSQVRHRRSVDRVERWSSPSLGDFVSALQYSSQCWLPPKPILPPWRRRRRTWCAARSPQLPADALISFLLTLSCGSRRPNRTNASRCRPTTRRVGSLRSRSNAAGARTGPSRRRPSARPALVSALLLHQVIRHPVDGDRLRRPRPRPARTRTTKLPSDEELSK